MINIKAKDLAALINGEILGDESRMATSICSIDDSKEGGLSFVTGIKFHELLKDTKVSIVIVPESCDKEYANVTLIKVKNPLLGFAKYLKTLDENKSIQEDIHKSAVISEKANIGRNVVIGANVVISHKANIGDNTIIMANSFVGEDVQIGSNCLLYSNVTINKNIFIGNNVIMHPGVVVGSDGFGYVFDKDNGLHFKVKQIGSVHICDNVEIGGNTVIDRGAIEDTFIGEGTKIDNLVHISHNVNIGKHCLVCGQVGIAGSTKVGDYVTFAGQAGVVGHIKIGNAAIVAAQAGVTKSVNAGEVVSGYPAMNHKAAKEIYVLLRKLPFIYKKLMELIKNK